MSASYALRQAVFSLFVVAATAMSASAQGVGAIAGTVTDASGAVLPGATVTLTSAQGTVGGNREVATDERGAYRRAFTHVLRIQPQLENRCSLALHRSDGHGLRVLHQPFDDVLQECLHKANQR
jgi:hypothetical protein